MDSIPITPIIRSIVGWIDGDGSREKTNKVALSHIAISSSDLQGGEGGVAAQPGNVFPQLIAINYAIVLD